MSTNQAEKTENIDSDQNGLKAWGMGQIKKLESKGAYNSSQVNEWKKWFDENAGKFTKESMGNYLLNKMKRDTMNKVKEKVSKGIYKAEQLSVWMKVVNNERNLDYLIDMYTAVEKAAAAFDEKQIEIKKQFSVNKELLSFEKQKRIEAMTQNFSSTENDTRSANVHKANNIVENNFLTDEEKKSYYAKICLSPSISEQNSNILSLKSFLQNRENDINQFVSLRKTNPETAQSFFNEKIKKLPEGLKNKFGLSAPVFSNQDVDKPVEKIEAKGKPVVVIKKEASKLKAKFSAETIRKLRNDTALQKLATQAKVLREVAQSRVRFGKGIQKKESVNLNQVENREKIVTNIEQKKEKPILQEEKKLSFFSRFTQGIANTFENFGTNNNLKVNNLKVANDETENVKQQQPKILKTNEQTSFESLRDENKDAMVQINLANGRTGSADQLKNLANHLRSGRVQGDQITFSEGDTGLTLQRTQENLTKKYEATLDGILGASQERSLLSNNVSSGTRSLLDFKLSNGANIEEEIAA